MFIYSPQNKIITFQQWLYDFEIHIFTLTVIGGLVHNYYITWKMYWCSRRQHNALRAVCVCVCVGGGGGGGGDGVVYFLNWMIRLNYTYFVFWETFKYLCSFVSAVPNEKKIGSLNKIRKMYTSSSCSKVYTPFSKCIVLPSWASVNVFTFCNSCVWVPQLPSVWKDGS